MRKFFWSLGSSSEGINSFWLMQWAIAGSDKLEKTRFSVTLLEQDLEGLGVLGRLGLEGLLLFMNPNFIL